MEDKNRQVEPVQEQSERVVRDRAFRRYTHITKELLEQLYISERLSTVEIASQLGVGRNTIWEYMAMYGLTRRPPGVAGALKSRVHQINADYFRQVDTDDKAYILGFIMGDGAVYDRGKSKRLVIGLAVEDRDLLTAIAERLGDRGFVHEALARSTHEQAKAILRVDNTELANDLLAAGIPVSPKSGHEVFLRLATPRLTWNFIRGVFDADGNIRVYERYSTIKGKSYGPYQKARLTITCGLPLVMGLRDFLIEEEFTFTSNCVGSKGITGLFEISNPATIAEMGRHMYEYGALWLLRKRVVFEKL
jgi:hypothetical protein